MIHSLISALIGIALSVAGWFGVQTSEPVLSPPATPVQVNEMLSATTTGRYTITFSGSIPMNIGAKDIYFGDGNSQGIAVPCGGGDQVSCEQLSSIPVSVTHTYKEAGDYAVEIKDMVSGAVVTQVVAQVVKPKNQREVLQPNPILPIPKNTVVDTFGALSVIPASGAKPLTVTFTYNYGDRLTRVHRIDFGDGTQSTLTAPTDYQDCGLTASCAPPIFSITHVYKTTGTYNVVLTDVLWVDSAEAYVQKILGTASVIVK